MAFALFFCRRLATFFDMQCPFSLCRRTSQPFFCVYLVTDTHPPSCCSSTIPMCLTVWCNWIFLQMFGLYAGSKMTTFHETCVGVLNLSRKASKLNGTRRGDGDFGFWSPTVGTRFLDRPYNVHTFNNFPKHDMFTVKPWGWTCCHKEL